MITTLIADVLLLISLAATVALGWALAPQNVPGGADRSMYGWVCIIIQTPRWICLTIVLLMCVARDGVPWPTDRAQQYVMVLLVQLLLGGGCFLASVTSLQKMSDPQWMSRSLKLMPFVLPTLQILFGVLVLNPALRTAIHPTTAATVTCWGWIIFAVAAALFGLIGGALYVINEVEKARTHREAEAHYRAAEDASAAAREEKFRNLTPADPLPDWLNFLSLDSTGPHNEIVLTAVAQRPNLAAEVDAELSKNELNAECRILQAIERLPPAAVVNLAVPFRKYGVRFCESLNDAVADPDIDSRRNTFGYARARATAYLAPARALHKAGVDVRPQLTAVVKTVRKQDFDSTRDIVRMYDHHLKEFSTQEFAVHSQASVCLRP